MGVHLGWYLVTVKVTVYDSHHFHTHQTIQWTPSCPTNRGIVTLFHQSVCFCTFFCLYFPLVPSFYLRPYCLLQWHITQQHTCDPWQLSPWPGAGLSLSKLSAIKQHDPVAPLGLSQMGVSNHSPMRFTVWRCCTDVDMVELNCKIKRLFSLQWH